MRCVIALKSSELEDQSLQRTLQKYLENKATAEEVRWLLAHFHTDSEDQLMQLIMKGFAIDKYDVDAVNPDQYVLNRVYNRLQRDLVLTGEGHRRKHNIRNIWNFAVAASVILVLSFWGYFLLHKQQSQQTAYYKNDIPPGHNQATLTLANGKKIILVKGLSGTLAQQGNTQIGVNGQSAIAYTAAVANADQPATYNTLSTAVGERSPYPLVLADGTKVWLNAKSSITFPTAFNGKERIVRITGEALFEVAHNAEHPFKVQTVKQTIEDIGTTFDVNAYTDEPATETTLIEGKVKVNGMFLQPGQQSDGSHIKTVNTKRYIAWKNNDFYFENDNIQTVMRELSRWYNVKINYEGDVTTEGFDAQISRNKNISAVLHILENTKGVHFKIEGRRITVIE